MSRLNGRFAFWGVLLAGSASVAVGADPPQRARDTLYYAAGLGVGKLNPMLKSHGWCEASSMIFNRLYRVSSTGQIEYDLLKSATFSSDLLTLTLDLKDNVLWHDGVRFSARDVVFTFDVLFDPKTPTDLDKDLTSLGSWKVAGPHRVVVTMKRPDPHIDGRLSEVPMLPRHVLHGADIATAASNETPIGTGAFMFDRREAADVLWLKANRRYHEGSPAIQRVKLVRIADDESRTLALWGKYDMGMVKISCIPDVLKRSHVRFSGKSTLFYDSGAWRGMPLNCRSEPLMDVRVRRAISLGIDRNILVRRAAPNAGEPAYVPMVPGAWAFSDDVRVDAAPNTTEAMRLLDEAGWLVGEDSMRRKGGRRLVLRMIVWKDEAFRRVASQVLKEQLEAIGIEVELHLFDNAGYNRNASNMGQAFDTFVGGWGGLSDPVGNIYRKFHSRGSQNCMGYSDAEVDRLIERAMDTPDRARSRAYLSKAVQRAMDAAVFIPLVYPKYTFVITRRLDHDRMPKGPVDSWYEITKHAYAWRFVDAAR